MLEVELHNSGLFDYDADEICSCCCSNGPYYFEKPNCKDCQIGKVYEQHGLLRRQQQILFEEYEHTKDGRLKYVGK